MTSVVIVIVTCLCLVISNPDQEFAMSVNLASIFVIKMPPAPIWKMDTIVNVTLDTPVTDAPVSKTVNGHHFQ